MTWFLFWHVLVNEICPLVAAGLLVGSLLSAIFLYTCHRVETK